MIVASHLLLDQRFSLEEQLVLDNRFKVLTNIDRPTRNRVQDHKIQIFRHMVKNRTLDVVNGFALVTWAVNAVIKSTKPPQ